MTNDKAINATADTMTARHFSLVKFRIVRMNIACFVGSKSSRCDSPNDIRKHPETCTGARRNRYRTLGRSARAPPGSAVLALPHLQMPRKENWPADMTIWRGANYLAATRAYRHGGQSFKKNHLASDPNNTQPKALLSSHRPPLANHCFSSSAFRNLVIFGHPSARAAALPAELPPNLLQYIRHLGSANGAPITPCPAS